MLSRHSAKLLALSLVGLAVTTRAHGAGSDTSHWLRDLDNKLCDKVGRVLRLVPGFRDSCGLGVPDEKPASHVPSETPELPMKLLAEMHLQEHGGSMRRLGTSSRQLLHAMSKIAQKQIRVLAEDRHQSLTLQIHAMSQELSAMGLQNSRLEYKCTAAEAEAARQTKKAEQALEGLQKQGAELQRRSAELQRESERSQLMCLLSGEPLSCLIPVSLVFVSLIVTAVQCIFVFLMVFARPKVPWKRQEATGKAQETCKIEKEMQDKTAELVRRLAQLDLEAVQDVDPSATVCITAEEQHMCDDLDADFSFRTFDTTQGTEALRSIKIKCPGVHHNDVIIDVVLNGCVVRIERKASQGVGAAAWTKRFQFTSADGFFYLKHDQVALEGGFLTLVFHAFRSRTFRFPKHFDMSSADVDDAWFYAEDLAVGHTAELAFSQPLARASHALRIAGTLDSVTSMASSGQQESIVPHNSASTSAASSSSNLRVNLEKLDDRGAKIIAA